MPLRPVAPPSAAERIGGRRAVSIWTAAAGCVALVALALAGQAGFSGALYTPPTFDLPEVAATCAGVCGVLLLAHLTVFRRRAERPVPVWAVALMGAVAGATRILVAELMVGDQLPVLSPIATVLAVVVVTASGAGVALAMAYLLATRDWYVEERRRLIRLEIETEARRLRAAGALDALEDVIIRSAQTEVDAAAAPARRALAQDDGDPARAAAALMEAARSGVRPIGRALAEQTGAAALPRVTIGRVLATQFRRHPLPIAIPALAVALLLVPRFLAAGSMVNAVLALVVLPVAITLVFLAFRTLVRRLPRAALPLTLAACALAAVPLPVLQRLSGNDDMSIAQGAALLTVVLFLLVGAVGFALTAEDAGEEVLERLRGPLQEADLERFATERARDDLLREIGGHLHSAVQPGLVAASYAIQDAVARGDADALDRAIAQARSSLEQRISPPSPAAPSDAATAIAASWEGIIDVDWETDPIPDGAQEAVIDVVREALANAVVHGHATRADVRVRADRGHLTVEVRDDGVGPLAGPAGMGTAVLNGATGGDWTREPGPHGGTLIRARIPVADAAR